MGTRETVERAIGSTADGDPRPHSQRSGLVTDTSQVDARARVRAGVRENSSDLLAYFERRTYSFGAHDAADLLSETLLQTWRRVDQVPQDQRQRRMWMFTIAANVLANRSRAARRRRALSERLGDQLRTAATSASDPAEIVSVRDAVLRLNTAQRELVMLVHWDGFTIVEAADVIGLNTSTARSRYAAARETLKAALTDFE